MSTVYDTNLDVFVIHIKTMADGWVVLRPTSGKPYAYTTGTRAWEIANMCYPDLTRSMRLGGEEAVRVTRLSRPKYLELFGVEAEPSEV